MLLATGNGLRASAGLLLNMKKTFACWFSRRPFGQLEQVKSKAYVMDCAHWFWRLPHPLSVHAPLRLGPSGSMGGGASGGCLQIGSPRTCCLRAAHSGLLLCLPVALTGGAVARRWGRRA